MLSCMGGAKDDWGKCPSVYEICVFIVVAGEDLPEGCVEKFKSVVTTWNERHCNYTYEPMRMRIHRKYFLSPPLSTQLQSTRRVYASSPVHAHEAADNDHALFTRAGFHQACVRIDAAVHGMDGLPMTSAAVELLRMAGNRTRFEFRVKVTGGTTHADLVELAKSASTQLMKKLDCLVSMSWDVSPGKVLDNKRVSLNLAVLGKGFNDALTILEMMCIDLPKYRLVHNKITPMRIFSITYSKIPEAAEPPQ